ncbi:potassium voltage-gated channel subfamily C member 1-like [Hydractinia symbiolongicarpus]|uniref:potassium voltage-gated channel subfamily C member 1-like n=1 Tax=Hydractinia symbiolongicarpus TaxID=13093 RepID=UPI00254C1E38|nr:potassium voltage-gated channel subfamily C member 1-like [Hydractinia symbiolongicarpus]XP_057317579.1 potassium voltage-gated channel subfamily C member 1-like [Hydractinia symbiolongicarpus]
MLTKVSTNSIGMVERITSPNIMQNDFAEDNHTNHVVKSQSSASELNGILKHKQSYASDTIVNGTLANHNEETIEQDIQNNNFVNKPDSLNKIESNNILTNRTPSPSPSDQGKNLFSPIKRAKSLKNKNKVNFEENSRALPRRSIPLLTREDGQSSRLRRISDEDDLSSCANEEKESELKQLKKDLERIKKTLKKYESKLESQEIASKLEDVSENTDENDPDLTAQQRANRNRVIINIGGIRHEIYRSTLKNIPDTRLSWIAEESAIHSPEYDPITKEFFFDRHPQVFSHILNYYRTGNLHVPYDVCGPLFEDELQYWGIDDSQVESCCWLTYRQHRDAQDTLKEFEGIEFEKDFDDDSEPDLSKYGFNVDEDGQNNDEQTWYQRWQPVLWKLMEDPLSSKKAKVLAQISMFLILLSVILFCLETMYYFSGNEDRLLVLNSLEGLCVLYFTIELSIRFAFCPDKIRFLKGIMNWIDFLAIIPFFVTVTMKFGFGIEDDLGYLQSIRIIRVFRIIKLSKHSVGLQILGHTLKASFRELLLLIFFLVIGIVIFSSLVYYCEYRQKDTKFLSIPTTFWWAVITMTTVGYGDMVPETVWGRIIGGLCSVSGVLMIALPVPVIVNNFNLYYSHAQARLKLPKKKRRMLCGAANALKGPAMEEFDRRNEDEDSPLSITRRAPLAVEVSNTDSEEDEDNTTEKLAALRLKRFARRDSNMFAVQRNGDLSPHTVTRNGSYALQKRRSLLPTMNSLPEIEQ